MAPAAAAPSVGVMPTAIITGASRGLGYALTDGLAKVGWQIVIDGRDAAALAVDRKSVV